MNQDFHSIFQKSSQHSRSIRKFKKSIDSPHDDTGITDEVLRELMNSTILSSGGNHLPHEYLMPSKNDSPETSEWVNGMHSFIHSHLFDCLKGVPEDEDIGEHHIVKPIMHATIHFIRNNPHPLLTKSSSVLLDMIKLFELQSEKLGKLSNKFYYQKPKIIEKSFSISERLKNKKLAKGRGEDARQAHSHYGASGFSEHEYPTGQMTETSPDGISHLGVFGEKRHILVQSNRPIINGRDQTHINWVHIEPGTEVKPHHVTQIFEALHAAGYTQPMKWKTIKDHDEGYDDEGYDDEGHSLRPTRRDRLFRPLAAQWDKFVAAKQGKSAVQKSAAWQRKEGQNPKGGLNAKGRASAKAEGHNLKSPVKSGDNPRRASFLARMGASPGPEHDEQGKPTRLLLSLQAWGASSKADARRKAKQISKRLEQKRKSNHDR